MADEEEFSFLEEQIMTSKKPKRQLVASVKKAAVSGICFGIVSGLCFAVTEHIVSSKYPEVPDEKIALETSSEPDAKVEATADANEEKADAKKKDAVLVMDAMQKFYVEFSNLFKKSKQSIVGVSSFDAEQEENPIYGDQSDCAGIIVAKTSKHVMILTSLQVLTEDGVRICFEDGTSVTGELYSCDTELGLAIIRVPLNKILDSTRKMIKVIHMGESTDLSVGDMVFALGNPNGELYSAECGYLTTDGSKKSISDYEMDIYTTSMGYHSKGYGIICNSDGEMLGLISQNGDTTENCTFYGISKLRLILENLLNHEEQTYAGITALELPSDIMLQRNLRSGIYVAGVREGAPAYEAGIRVGDIICSVEGTEISSVVSFYECIQEHKVGDKITLTILKDPYGSKKEKRVKLTLSGRN